MKRVNQLKLQNTVKVVEQKDRGKTTGYEIHYGDGRQAAVVRPDTVRYKLRRA